VQEEIALSCFRSLVQTSSPLMKTHDDGAVTRPHYNVIILRLSIVQLLCAVLSSYESSTRNFLCV